MEIIICMGSSCHSRGNRENVRIARDFIAENSIGGSVKLTGCLCMEECSRNISVPDKKNHSGRELTAVMESIGKYSPEDELNCGGCGYNTCRDFAEAVLEYKAEAVMCVSYMRTLAQKKANAIIEKMPSGVVIADSSHKVIECNRKFAELLGEETLLLWDSRPNLEGANLEKMLPFYGLFNQVTESGREIIDRKVEYKKRSSQLLFFRFRKDRSQGQLFRILPSPGLTGTELSMMPVP